MELKFRNIREIEERTSRIENQFWVKMLELVDLEHQFFENGFDADFSKMSNDLLDLLKKYDPSFYNYFIHNK